MSPCWPCETGSGASSHQADAWCRLLIRTPIPRLDRSFSIVHCSERGFQVAIKLQNQQIAGSLPLINPRGPQGNARTQIICRKVRGDAGIFPDGLGGQPQPPPAT